MERYNANRVDHGCATARLGRPPTGRGAAATAQLRTVRAGTNGNWVNLAAGTHTVQVDWAAGGALVLRIDGTQVSSQTGVSGTARVETVRLGSVTAGTSGIGYFDTFVSGRNSV